VVVQINQIGIVHGGAPERPVGEGKTAGLYHMNGHPHAGTKAQQCAGVLGLVRLKKRDIHGWQARAKP
jgi:hypothetical protein